MRRSLSTAMVFVLAIVLPSSFSWAQSGTEGIVPSISNAVQAISQSPITSQPAITSATPVVSAPTLQMEPSFSSPAMATANSSQAVASAYPSSVMASPPMSYAGPVAGGWNPGPASNSYGPVSVGPYPQGRACCDLSPTPTVTPSLKPVTSCCSQNGRLGVPPLLTPIRYDMPPVGRSVGRPLFGKWNGF
jgi:hypothetical protein